MSRRLHEAKDERARFSCVSACVMSPASFASSSDQDLHFVLCDFGRYGRAYVETDPAQADASTIIRKLLQGQYGRPLSVLALNTAEGRVQDVSALIARSARKPGADRRNPRLHRRAYRSRRCHFGPRPVSLDPRSHVQVLQKCHARNRSSGPGVGS
jgi:hypothetical protein